MVHHLFCMFGSVWSSWWCSSLEGLGDEWEHYFGNRLSGQSKGLPLSAAFFRAWCDSSAAPVLWLISTSPAVKALSCSCVSAIILSRIYNSPGVCAFSPIFICQTHTNFLTLLGSLPGLLKFRFSDKIGKNFSRLIDESFSLYIVKKNDHHIFRAQCDVFKLLFTQTNKKCQTLHFS